MIVSVFKNLSEVSENLAMPVILEQIKDGRFKSQVEPLRALLQQGNKEEYDKKKKSLPSFTPSGTFNSRRILPNLNHYSGCIIIDIDKLTPEQLSKAKSTAIEIPFTYACFISPSNNGLKILVKVDSKPIFHKQAFNQVKEHYETLLQIPIDPSGKDITRLCFFSYDEDLYLNTYSEIFITFINMLEQDIEKVVQQIEANQIDITTLYKDWLNVGFALIDALGEGGREYFHRISKFYPTYDYTLCNDQFDKCLKSNNSGITAKSFFGIAKDHGLDISPVESYDLSEYKTENKSEDKIASELKKKRKKNHIDVIEAFLNNRYGLRYNVVTANLEVKKTGTLHFEPITDYIENSILREMLKNNLRCSISKLRNILFSDFCRMYNPFEEYFNNLPPWDGDTDHILKLSQTITTTNDELWQYCFKKWLVAVVTSALVKNVVNQTAIIFSGPQGIGKTTWMVNLCPPSLSSYLFSGTINPTNKDTLIHLSECLYINMDELENMNRTEIGTLKEIITNTSIRIRRPYGHNNENMVRRASFMGSVNTSQFLNDSTGSRRFLCFEVTEIDYKHPVDMAKVYSQALHLFNQGFVYWFEKADIEMITLNNEQFQIRTSEEELLLTYFEPVPLSDAHTFYSATQILAKIANYAKINVTNGAAISMGRALKKHGFEKTKKGGIYAWAVIEIFYTDAEANSNKPLEPPF